MVSRCDTLFGGSPNAGYPLPPRSLFRLTALRLPPPPLGPPDRPAHYAVLELVVRHVVLPGADAAAHRDAGLVHGLGVAGDQRVPPVEVVAVGHQPVAAGRRQPDDSVDVTRG